MRRCGAQGSEEVRVPEGVLRHCSNGRCDLGWFLVFVAFSIQTLRCFRCKPVCDANRGVRAEQRIMGRAHVLRRKNVKRRSVLALILWPDIL